MMTSAPRFRGLARDEAVALLARNHVGRVAFALHERVEIVPLHYVYEDGWIFGRTEFGRKLEDLKAHWWIAFEVDEVDDLFDWRSVIVHGGFYVLDPGIGPREAELSERALAALRTIVPETLAPGDPVPERTLLFGIAAQEITGRAAESAAASQEGRPE